MKSVNKQTDIGVQAIGSINHNQRDNQMKKTFLFLFLSFLVFGCAPSVTKINIPEINKSDDVLLQDLRPETENSDEIFSYLITSDAYGINRLGGTTLVPTMTRLLQHRVYEKFGNSTHPIEIIVHHMVAYLNMQSRMKTGILAGTIAGPIGALAASGSSSNNVTVYSSIVDLNNFESTAEDEYKRALYTEKENPNKVIVIITYIDAEINGKRVFIKTMSPTELPENQDPIIYSVESAIKYYLDQY